MKSIIISLLSVLLLSTSLFAQDVRTLDTKVTDILAQLPADNQEHTDKLMNEVVTIGMPAIQILCDGIIPAGTGDDTASRMAIESLTRFVSTREFTNEAAQLEKTYLKEIAKSNSEEVKSFYLRRLNSIGTTASVDQISEYVTNGPLGETAVTTLNAIGGAEVCSALNTALPQADEKLSIAIVKALGDEKCQSAASAIEEACFSNNAILRSTAYVALSQIAAPSSFSILKKAATEANFVYEKSDATSAFLEYGDELTKKGNYELAASVAETVLGKTKKDAQMSVRIQAFTILSNVIGNEATPELIKEFTNSTSKRVREAIAFIAFKDIDASGINQWVSTYNSTSTTAQAELLPFLVATGKSFVQKDMVRTALNSSAVELRTVALAEAEKLEGTKSLNTILDYASKWDTEADKKAVETALRVGPDQFSLNTLASNLSNADKAYQPIYVTTICNRRMTNWFDTVIEIAKSGSNESKKAAIAGLAKVATKENIGSLVSLLDASTNASEIANIQKAVVASIKSDDSDKTYQVFKRSVTSAKRPENFYGPMAKLGGREALAFVANGYKSGTQTQKNKAFEALTEWCNSEATMPLFEICSTTKSKDIQAKSFNGYIAQVRSSNLPVEQKLLLLRKLFNQASNDQQRNQILAQTGGIKTFPSLLFTAKYLDNKALANTAGKSVMGICLPTPGQDNGMSGQVVREALTKTVNVISGGDAQYFKIDINEYLGKMSNEEGYVSMFNGKDLTGWKGLVGNPISRSKMSPAELAKKQKISDSKISESWSVRDGAIWFNGKGNNLCSTKDYGDFEMVVDWKITKHGDSGIYLKGSPQVQIWDTSRVEVGAQVGSGGLYNNQKNARNPLKVADNQVGEWNSFYIKMIGDKVTVVLNGELVVDNVTMENYWDRSIPLFDKGAIELQAHGTDLAFRDIYVHEIKEGEYNLTNQEKSEGFKALFNGKDLTGWIGNKTDYIVSNNKIGIYPKNGGHGNLYTEKEYDNFVFRFEFQLTPGANNGLGIHAPLEGDAAYVGKELQILDNTAAIYANLQKYQYHGSLYGIMPSKRGFLKPVGEWNKEEVTVNGDYIKIVLNGETILEGNYAEAAKNGTADHKDHPGLNKKIGHIGFLGHGSHVNFKNIRLKEL